LGECGPCPVLARFTLAFALQLRKKHGKTSVRVEYKISDNSGKRGAVTPRRISRAPRRSNTYL